MVRFFFFVKGSMVLNLSFCFSEYFLVTLDTSDVYEKNQSVKYWVKLTLWLVVVSLFCIELT